MPLYFGMKEVIIFGKLRGKKNVIKGITKVHEKLFEFKNYQTISQIS
jgi:hypothetical protein